MAQEKVRSRSRLPALAVAFALSVAGGVAEGASVLSFFKTGANLVSDEDREYLIDRSENGVAGRLDVGDSLRGLANFNTLNSSSANLGGLTGNNEWTVVFQAMVTSKIPVDPIPGPVGDEFFLYTFGPDPAFAADLSGGMGAATGFAPGAGALFVFFEGGTVAGGNNFASDFNDPTPPTAGPDDGTLARTVPPSSADVSVGPYAIEETFVATAHDGLAAAHFWTVGFTGAGGAPDPTKGEGWSFFGLPGLGDNVLNAFNFASGTSGGTFNVGVTRLAWNLGIGDGVTILPLTAGAFGPVEFAGSGEVRGVNDLDTPFEVSSNAQFSFRVPEPATVALIGLGLLGIGTSLRLRNRGRRRAAY